MRASSQRRGLAFLFQPLDAHACFSAHHAARRQHQGYIDPRVDRENISGHAACYATRFAWWGALFTAPVTSRI
jgi:hypothetical protein